MQIDLYADVVCPWCYIGEARLAAALAQRPDLDVTLRWRPFQLHPDAPPAGIPWAAFVDTKFGGRARAQAMFAHVERAAAGDGLTFAFDRVVSAPNTVDAHRLILWAEAQGQTWAMAHRLFAAYFAEGADLNDADTLAQLAAEAGLDADAARAHLSSDAGREAVAAGQAQAAQLGIQGVPFYVFEGRFGVSGAQPVEAFVEALDRVVKEMAA